MGKLIEIWIELNVEGREGSEGREKWKSVEILQNVRGVIETLKY